MWASPFSSREKKRLSRVMSLFAHRDPEPGECGTLAEHQRPNR